MRGRQPPFLDSIQEACFEAGARLGREGPREACHLSTLAPRAYDVNAKATVCVANERTEFDVGIALSDIPFYHTIAGLYENMHMTED
jgi:hypothetical protein